MSDLAKLATARDHALSGTGRLLRQSAGISLREMARAISVDPTTLLRWERGENRPRGAAAMRWQHELRQLAERHRRTA
jgi:transcriptional regulator with XRE-family HTH domain